MRDDLEIRRLIAGIKAEYEPETIGQRELFFEHLAEMELPCPIDASLAIILHRFG